MNGVNYALATRTKAIWHWALELQVQVALRIMRTWYIRYEDHSRGTLESDIGLPLAVRYDPANHVSQYFFVSSFKIQDQRSE